MRCAVTLLLLALVAAAGTDTISEFDRCAMGDCEQLTAAGDSIASIDGAGDRTRDGASVAALKRSAEGQPAGGGGSGEGSGDPELGGNGETEVPAAEPVNVDQLNAAAAVAEERVTTAEQPEPETVAGDGGAEPAAAEERVATAGQPEPETVAGDGGGAESTTDGGTTPLPAAGIADVTGAAAEEQGSGAVTEPPGDGGGEAAGGTTEMPGGSDDDAGGGQDGDSDGGETDELDWRTDYCTCDLTVSECDVDCCCDPDCDGPDRLAFSACQTRPSVTPDRRYCLQSDLIFSNNTETRLERVEGGMFCIVRDNLVSRNSFSPVQPVSSSAEFERLLSREVRGRRYWWEAGPPPPPPPPPTADRYRSGDLMWTITDGTPERWVLQWRGPVSAGLCDAVRPVRFLRSAQTDCWLAADPARLQPLNGRLLYQGLCVLTAPTPSSGSLQDLKSVECGRPRDPADDSTARPALPDTVRVLPYLCSSDQQNCTQVTEVPEPRVSAGRLLDALLSVSVVVEQRAGRVSGVRAELVLGPAAVGSSVRQRRQLTFRRPGGPPPLLRSGNPGYQRHLPLLSVRMVTNTTGVQPPRRTPSGPGRPVVLPSPGRGGGCSADARHWRPLVFGVDAVVSCRLEVAAGDCGALQRRVLTTLLAGLPAAVSDTGVAALGSAAVSGEWLPILGGAPDPSPETLQEGCRGLVTAARWRVAFAQAGAAWRPQARVVGVQLTYGRPGSVWTDAAGRLALDLQTVVSFVDVTERPVPRFAQPPRVDISLPSDFFYPFTAGRAAGTGPPAGLAVALWLWVTVRMLV